MNFGEMIKRYRERMGLSKADVGRELGVTRSYIGGVEASRYKVPTFKRCEQFIKTFKLSAKEAEGLLHTAAQERAPEETEIAKGLSWVPVVGKIPGNDINLHGTVFNKYIEIPNYPEKNIIAVEVKENILANESIVNGFILIVSRQAPVKKGCLVLVRIKDLYTVKRFYRMDENTVKLESRQTGAQKDQDAQEVQEISWTLDDDKKRIENPELQQEKKEAEIIGRIMRAVKKF